MLLYGNYTSIDLTFKKKMDAMLSITKGINSKFPIMKMEWNRGKRRGFVLMSGAENR